jgi:hypothetical protein
MPICDPIRARCARSAARHGQSPSDFRRATLQGAVGGFSQVKSATLPASRFIGILVAIFDSVIAFFAY